MSDVFEKHVTFSKTSCIFVKTGAKPQFSYSGLSPYADNMSVSILVKNLYIVFASAIGLWFVRRDGSPFL